MLDVAKCIVDDNVVFQQESAPVHVVFNTVQLVQCKNINFIFFLSYHPITVQCLTSPTIRFRELQVR